MTDTQKLEAIRESITSWRATKRIPNQRIPKELWARIDEALQEHPLVEVSRWSGISTTRLERRLASKASLPAGKFVELSPRAVSSVRIWPLELEWRRADGAVLTARVQGAHTMSLSRLAGEFLGAV